jgi:hypothetical protein
MGIEHSETEGRIATLARLTEPVSWAEVCCVPIHGNVIDVRHVGRTETRLTNRSGEAITWIARFYRVGEIEVDGKALDTKAGKDDVGASVVWGEIPVAAGTSKTACAVAP